MRAVELLLFAATAAGLYAQADLFSKAPPDVDQALRARVSKFYQAHVDGKPRVAMSIVAEDTQDLWFDTDKPKYNSFEILAIKYAPDFKKADVTVAAAQLIKTRFGETVSKVPTTTKWRIDDGAWVYYVDKESRGTRDTPFGKMKAGPGEAGSLGSLKSMIDPSKISLVVKINKSDVQLGDSDEVIITNSLPGVVNLTLEVDKMEGLTGKLDRTKLEANSNAKAVFEFKGSAKSAKPNLQARIIVQETQQVIPVNIKFR